MQKKKGYPESRGDNYTTVRIPRGQIEEIESFLKTDFARKRGYLHKVEVVSDAVRKFLEEYQPRFEHLKMVDDSVKVIDFENNRIATIHFKEEGLVLCDLCDAEDCEHIEYALARVER